MVYGYPAILSAVNRRLFVEIEKGQGGVGVVPTEGTSWVRYAIERIKESLGRESLDGLRIKINSQFPIGCGMGSSAAFAVAITAAVFKFVNYSWNLEKINQIAYEIEKRQHGNPSGGDNTVSAYGGFLWYRKEAEG